VGKFIFHVDFVVIDIEEDNEVPLIFGRPFMKIPRVVIDIDEGKLKVRAQNDEVTFNVFDGLNISNVGEYCLQRDATKEAFLETKERLDLSNVFEKVIHHFISKAEEKKKKPVPKFVEKPLPNKESSTLGTKEKDKVQ